MSHDLDRAVEYSDFDEARLRHLELVQAAISRLGTNGFLVKGWALTAAGVLLGFAVDRGSWQLAAISLLPTLGFWALDTYFLRCERLFRHLYDRVRIRDETIAPFYMSATESVFAGRAPRKVRRRWTTFWRPVLSLFYGGILIATAVVVLLLAGGKQASQPGVAPAASSSPGETVPAPTPMFSATPAAATITPSAPASVPGSVP